MRTKSNTPPLAELAEWLRAKEVKTVFGIGRTPLDKLRKLGRITTTTLKEGNEKFGTVLYNAASIRAYLESKQEKATATTGKEVRQ